MMTWRTTKLFTSKCSLRSVNILWVTDHDRRVWILPGRLKAPRFLLHSFSCHRTCEVLNHISILDFCLCHKNYSSQKVTTWHWEALAVVFQNPFYFFPCHWFTNFIFNFCASWALSHIQRKKLKFPTIMGSYIWISSYTV